MRMCVCEHRLEIELGNNDFHSCLYLVQLVIANIATFICVSVHHSAQRQRCLCAICISRHKLNESSSMPPDIYTAGIISLLTHSCMSVAFNIVVHPQLTYQSPYHLGLHATLTAPTPAIPSQIEIFSKHSVTCRQTADAVSSRSQSH